ncbi:MlaD family protein [soil metagenome]
MNDRVMQFRIGMFVIVAGLVLTMMIVWFESHALMTQRQFVTVYFREAPGIDSGIPVRKSGVRVGEVASFEFTPDDEPEDGVLVTLSLDPKYPIRAGTVPKLGRALIGDVSIDLLPGDGQGPLTTYSTPAEAQQPENRIVGLVATDPFVLLSGAAKTFERAEDTLSAISTAANGLATLTEQAEGIDEFLVTWTSAGERIDSLAADFSRVVQENEEDFRPAVVNIRRVSEKLDTMLDDQTQANVRQSLDRIAAASARLDSLLADLEPLAKDLSAEPNVMPRTNVGQVVFRLNRVAYDISLLTSQFSDGRGGLNRNGSLQRFVTDPQLYNNLNAMAKGAQTTADEARGVLRNLSVFAQKIAKQPSLISEGVLSPR